MVEVTTAANSITGPLSGIFGGLMWMLIALVVICILFTIFGLIWWFIWHKRTWNLDVEFKLPRSDGKFVGAEWGKGSYRIKSGKVFLKRKGIAKQYMKPFDVRKYLQGGKVLTVVQVSPNEYIPVMPKSYLHLVDDKTGQECSVLEIYSDTGRSKSWKNYLERDLKNTFSIQNLFQQYQLPISMAIIMIGMCVGFAILWSKIQ
jgi:hypothetical protein